MNCHNQHSINYMISSLSPPSQCQSQRLHCHHSERASPSPPSSKIEGRRISFIYELPYNTRKALCDLLDADGSWKQLGGEYMGLNDTQLTLISHALYRGASPTNDLLIRWEASNPKVTQLYKYLANMRHQRAMLILRSFVDDKLQSLCVEMDDHSEEFGATGGVKLNYFDTPLKDTKFVPHSHSQLTENKIINNNLNDLNTNLKGININADDRNYKLKHINDNRKMSRDEKSMESTRGDFDEIEVPYKELLLATDDFSNERVLGSGGFGIVYRGEWKGTKVAVKRLKGCDNMSQALTELRVLNRYRIDNILPLYGVSLDGPEACLLYQYMSNGSLEDRLLCKNGSKPLAWAQRSNIGEGMAKALNYLHTLKGDPLVHGDVKSANVLLDQLNEPKLGDFGLARQVIGRTGLYTHVTVSAVHGTSVYLPPEYLRQKILSPAVDVYSYGIVILEMATGRRAFDGKKLLIDLVEDEMKMIEITENKDFNKLMDPRMAKNFESGNWFNSLLKLGRDCAQRLKKKRPSMIQVLEYYSQCKTCDKIRRLSAEAAHNNVESLPTSNIKTPLELQLWYDMIRKGGGPQSETVCPTINTQQDIEESGENSMLMQNIESESIEMGKTNVKQNDDSIPILPLITELGFNINNTESQ